MLVHAPEENTIMYETIRNNVIYLCRISLRVR